MTCQELVDLLCDFIAEELSPERRAHIEQHLQKCPPCVVFVETYRLTIHLTRKLPCTELPPHLAQRLQAALQAQLHCEDAMPDRRPPS